MKKLKESDCDKEFVKFLRSKGCFVMKLTPGVAGIPVGVSDRVFFKEGFYGFAEIKKSKTAPFRPLQQEFLAKMNEWSWAKAVYPENRLEIQAELSLML